MEAIAIVHFVNYPKGQDRPCMAGVMRYTAQEEKTMWEDRHLVSGFNCCPESVYDDFLSTKLLHRKEGGTLFYHLVQSFPAGERVDPAAAHAAALKLAEYFQGREVLVCTHTDRDHIHSHLIINSVSLEDGKSSTSASGSWRSCVSATTRCARRWICRCSSRTRRAGRGPCPTPSTVPPPGARAGSSRP